MKKLLTFLLLACGLVFAQTQHDRINTRGINNVGAISNTGTSATDLPTYGSELLSSSGWTSTGWTGSFAAGWTHTAGNTTALSQSTAAVNATQYQISYAITGQTAGSITVAFGGTQLAGITTLGPNPSAAFGPTTVSTANLVVTPTTDFDGAIIFSIKAITAVSQPIAAYLSKNGGNARMEIRAVAGGDNNTFVGTWSGQYNTTGINNTGFGVTALSHVTTGFTNTAMGLDSLFTCTTCYFNTAYGNNALGFLLDGADNTAGGEQALLFLASGSFRNTAWGSRAGTFISDGVTNNTLSTDGLFLGRNAFPLASGDSNEIVIGTTTNGAGNNTVVLGNTNITDAFFGGQSAKAKNHSKRFYADGGTVHVVGDWVLGGNWGTSPSVSAVAATDQGGRVTILAGGGAPGANPTITLTFKDGTWTNAPACVASRGDVSSVGFWALTTPSATAPVWTFAGTPAASSTYVLDFICMGR